MAKIKVAVIRGGAGSGYSDSLKAGEMILKHLPAHYLKKDIFVSRDGEWHIGGFVTPPEKALRGIDAVFNTIEEGRGRGFYIKRMLEEHRIPFVGSGSFTAGISRNRIFHKEAFKNLGVKLPHHILIDADEAPEKAASDVFQAISPPWVIKPAFTKFGEEEVVEGFYNLEKSLKKALEKKGSVVSEEFVKGRDAVCFVLEGFRGQEHYILPIVEVVCGGDGKFHPISHIRFDSGVKEKIESAALEAHKILGCRAFSQSHMAVSGRKVYFLDVDVSPGFLPSSPILKAAGAAGLSTSELIEHLIKTALTR